MRPLFFLPLFAFGHNNDRFTPKCSQGQFRLSDVKNIDEKILNLYSRKLDHEWGACVMQGHRNHMEDRIITKSYFNNVYSLYIVFDGHGGDTVVKFAEKQFVDFLLKQGEELFRSFESDPSSYDPKKIETLFKVSFPIYDRQLMHEEPIHNALLNPNVRSTSGCTCTGVVITHTHIIAFNTGDSRTLLLNESENTVKFATVDHKPDDPEETRRIKASGGFVSLPPQTYIPRVNGQLALSRAFGDFQLKMAKKKEQHEQAVITDPDITIFDRQDISHIVVASDGVYDGLENDIVKAHALSKNGFQQDKAKDMLLDSLKNRSSDNMAAIIIDLFGQNNNEVDSGIESDTESDQDVTQTEKDEL